MILTISDMTGRSGVNMILYINSCIRNGSRTDLLARELLKKLGNEHTELKLAEEDLHPLNAQSLDKRTGLIEASDYSDPMFRYAKQFASADIIVIAAPFWDMSFPAELKIYLENIYVTGIVSRYGPDGRPEGLCRASALYYVTTAGGPYSPAYSYDMIKELAEIHFGIKKTALLKAEMLDVFPDDAGTILQRSIEEIDGII